jgi:chromosome segregation ATPase
MKNVDAKPKTLILEQAAMDQYSLLSPFPAERTATAYRFEVKLPASGTERLKVEQEQVSYNNTTVLSSTPDFLLTIVTNKQLTAEGRKQLQAITDVKHRIAETDASLNSTKSQTSDLNGDQSRLRQNIDSLNRVKGQEDQVRKYSMQLADNETQLAKLRDQTRNLAQRQTSLANDLRGLIDSLDF